MIETMEDFSNMIENEKIIEYVYYSIDCDLSVFAVVCVYLFQNVGHGSWYFWLSTPEFNFYIFCNVYNSDTQSKDVKSGLNKKK